MKVLVRKLKSALRLLSREDGMASFAKRIRRNCRQARVQLSSGKGFRFRHQLGFPFWVKKSDDDLLRQFLDQDHDVTEAAVMKAWVEAGDRVADCGANIGLFSALLAECVGRSGKVLAVEASPATFAKLQMVLRALELQEFVIPAHVCATDVPGIARFDVTSPESEWHALAAPAVEGTPPPSSVVSVTAVRLDDLLSREEMPEPSFIKIDVEGAEPLVLKGLSASLSTAALALYIVEIFRPGLERMGFSPADILPHFPVERFELWHIPLSESDLRPGLVRGRAYPLPDPGAHAWPYLSNLIAIPRTGSFAARRSRLTKALAGD